VESMQGMDEGEEEPEIPAPTTLPKAGLRIGIHLSLVITDADPDADPAFYLNTHPDPLSQTNADVDLDRSQTLKS
jgi:hypothetical protein